MSRSHASPPGLKDQQGNLDDALQTIQAYTDEVEALRIAKQHLLRDLEELTRQMQRHQEERQHHDTPRNVDGEGETSRAKELDPYKPLGEDRNERITGRNNIGNGPSLYQWEIGEQSWKQRFRDIQQELSLVRETMKERALVSMDALVQQTESSFTVRGTTLPSPNEVQNASNRTVQRNERSYRPPQFLQESNGVTWVPAPLQMQSFCHHIKRPGFSLVQQTPPIVNLILQRAIHRVRLPLHRSSDIQEAELSLANHKVGPTGKPEVLRLNV